MSLLLVDLLYQTTDGFKLLDTFLLLLDSKFVEYSNKDIIYNDILKNLDINIT